MKSIPRTTFWVSSERHEWYVDPTLLTVIQYKLSKTHLSNTLAPDQFFRSQYEIKKYKYVWFEETLGEMTGVRVHKVNPLRVFLPQTLTTHTKPRKQTILLPVLNYENPNPRLISSPVWLLDFLCWWSVLPEVFIKEEILLGSTHQFNIRAI